MTEQPASAEALRIANCWVQPYLPTKTSDTNAYSCAQAIDALCEQRIAAETEWIVGIIKALAKIYAYEDGFDTGWRMACERIILYIKENHATDPDARECPPTHWMPLPPSPSESSPTTTAATRWQTTLKAEKAAILDFVVDGKIGDDPSPPAVVDYTERAREALDGMPDCLRLYLEKAGADDKDFPIIRAWLTAALSAVASEHQAAHAQELADVRAGWRREHENWTSVLNEPRAALLARLLEPEMREAVRVAVTAEYVESEDLLKIADAALAVITEKLTTTKD